MKGVCSIDETLRETYDQKREPQRFNGTNTWLIHAPEENTHSGRELQDAGDLKIKIKKSDKWEGHGTHELFRKCLILEKMAEEASNIIHERVQ